MAKYKTRKLDSNGDIMTSGAMWIYDIEAVAQTCETRLKLFTKEFWRDVREGVPWKTGILGKNNGTLQAKLAIIKKRISETDGVLSILSFDSDFDYNDRNLIITTDVLTEFGVATISTDDAANIPIESNELQKLLLAVEKYCIASTAYVRL